MRKGNEDKARVISASEEKAKKWPQTLPNSFKTSLSTVSVQHIVWSQNLEKIQNKKQTASHNLIFYLIQSNLNTFIKSFSQNAMAFFFFFCSSGFIFVILVLQTLKLGMLERSEGRHSVITLSSWFVCYWGTQRHSVWMWSVYIYICSLITYHT